MAALSLPERATQLVQGLTIKSAVLGVRGAAHRHKMPRQLLRSRQERVAHVCILSFCWEASDYVSW